MQFLNITYDFLIHFQCLWRKKQQNYWIQYELKCVLNPLFPFLFFSVLNIEYLHFSQNGNIRIISLFKLNYMVGWAVYWLRSTCCFTERHSRPCDWRPAGSALSGQGSEKQEKGNTLLLLYTNVELCAIIHYFKTLSLHLKILFPYTIMDQKYSKTSAM